MVPFRTLDVGVSSVQGRTKSRSNEDRFSYEKIAPDIQYYGVFDGHNGNFVSQFVNKNLPNIIKGNIETNRSDLYDEPFFILENVLVSSILHCQHILEETMVSMEDLKRKDMIGSTAVVALLLDSKFLSVANLGDSKAILCRDGKPVELSVEHVPSNKYESTRVMSSGGWIDWDSRLTPLVNGRLTMTRSFGNLLLKPDIVPCDPQIQHTTIDELKDSFIVLCSDGVTHAMTNDEIVSIVGYHEKPIDAASDLTSTAHQYGSQDDATALVVPLGVWECGQQELDAINYISFRTILGGRSDG